jgi:hypothetical protein
MAVTKKQAAQARHGDEFHYTGRHMCDIRLGPRGGKTTSITRVKVVGKCKVWKTRPKEFRLPVKWGLYESSAIEHHNASDWHRAGDCPTVQTT